MLSVDIETPLRSCCLWGRIRERKDIPTMIIGVSVAFRSNIIIKVDPQLSSDMTYELSGTSKYGSPCQKRTGWGGKGTEMYSPVAPLGLLTFSGPTTRLIRRMISPQVGLIRWSTEVRGNAIVGWCGSFAVCRSLSHALKPLLLVLTR